MKTSSFVQGLIAGTIAVTLLAGVGILSLYTLPNPESLVTAANQSVVDLSDPPTYLSINGERWYIQSYDFTKADPLTDGATSCEQRRIWYDSARRTKAEFREILWHEVFHASYCYQGSRMKANWSEYTHD